MGFSFRSFWTKTGQSSFTKKKWLHQVFVQNFKFIKSFKHQNLCIEIDAKVYKAQ
jgi:hypothetical protein